MLRLAVLALVVAGGCAALGYQGLMLSPDPDVPPDFSDFAVTSGAAHRLAAVAVSAVSPVAGVCATVLLTLLTAWSAGQLGGERARWWAGLLTAVSAAVILPALASPWVALLLTAWGVLLASAVAYDVHPSASRSALAGAAAGVLAGLHIWLLVAGLWLLWRLRRHGIVYLIAALLAGGGTVLAGGTALRSDAYDVAGMLPAAMACDWQQQLALLAEVKPAATLPAALGLVAAEWRTGEQMVRLADNLARFLHPAESDDAYPWTAVRLHYFVLRLLVGWVPLAVLALLGWRTLPDAQRALLLPFVTVPLLAGMLFAPALLWRGLLTVALSYSAARGIARLREAEAPRLAWMLVLGAMLLWQFWPAEATSLRTWRGAAQLAIRHGDTETMLRFAEAWATRAATDDEAWWLAHYAARCHGNPALAQQYLLRACLYAPNAYRLRAYAIAEDELAEALAQQAAFLRGER